MSQFCIPKKIEASSSSNQDQISSILRQSEISNILATKGEDLNKYPQSLIRLIELQEQLIDNSSLLEIQGTVNKNLQDKNKLVEILEFSKILYDGFKKDFSFISIDSKLCDPNNSCPLNMKEWKKMYPLKNIAMDHFVADLKVNGWSVSQSLKGTSNEFLDGESFTSGKARIDLYIK